MAKGTILLADDDKSICTVLSHAIRRSGFNVITTDDANELLAWAGQGKGDLIITDVLMPKGNGLEFLPQIKRIRPELPVIVISANNTLMTAVKAAELGAYEYFSKPFDLDALVGCVEQSLALKNAESKLADIAAIPEMETQGESAVMTALVGRSPAMQQLYKGMARLVSVDLTVLLQGESGTGKELVARTLHALSPRSKKPFVAINMAAMPRELVESELFGHEKGAFTGAHARKAGRFEQAEGGTLFLDEIGDMPFDVQTKLLRILQEREYTPVGGMQTIKTNVRIICATHRDLHELVKAGSFREDLYYRIHVVPLHIPPLRDRKEDIEALALHCLERARSKGLPEKRFSADAIKALQHYAWPGNVRELENMVFRLAALETDVVIQAHSVRDALHQQPVIGLANKAKAASLQTLVELHLQQYFSALKNAMPPSGLYERILEAVEKPLLKSTLDLVKGNQLKAADILGINRNTLRKKLRERGVATSRGAESDD